MREKDTLATYKERYKVLEEYWADNRTLALADMKFAAGHQWPEDIKKLRRLGNRPCLTVDKSGQYIRQVVNDSRQNRPAIKVRPIDDEGDIEVAEALQGIVRHVADRSNADDAYDWAIECAVKGGFGWVRVMTDYAHDNTFNQEISIERVPDALSVLMAPHQKADGSDAADCFVVTNIPKEEFKTRWPKAKETDWESKDYQGGWADDNTVRVCEYFYKVEEKTLRHLIADGTVVSDDDYQRAITELGEGAVPAIQDSRELPTVKVKWCRMTGAEILEERDWLGKHLPIVPCYGNESNINGKVIYTSLIHSAIDAMMLYNFSRSAYAERVALTPKAPWIAPAEATDGHPEWEDANEKNYSVLHYNALDSNGQQLPQPNRQPASDIPEGFARDMALSEHDIQAAMGMYNASLGEKSNEKSGKAIMARQREGDTATFHFQDNLNRCVRQVGAIVVDLAPKVWDSRRTIRLLGESGDATEAMVDPKQEQPVTKQGGKSIYNLSIGVYDVNVSTGASYTTRRVEQAEAMMQMAQANPQAWMTHGDLIAKSQDWPNSEEWAKRSLLAMPPELRQAVEKEDTEGNASPEMQKAQQYVDQAMQQVQQAQQQIQQAGQQLQQEQQKSEAEKAQLDAQAAKIQAEAAKLEAAKHQIDSSVKVMQVGQKVETEQQRIRELEFELMQQEAKHALEEINEQAIEQIKALLVPTPNVAQPGAAPPPGPSPELSAILEQFSNQTQAIMQAVSAPRKRQLVRGPDGRPDHMIETMQ